MFPIVFEMSKLWYLLGGILFILGDSEYNYPTVVGKVLPVYEALQRHLLNQYEKNLLNTAAQIEDNLSMWLQ